MRCFKYLVWLMLLWNSSAEAKEVTTAGELQNLGWEPDNTTLELQKDIQLNNSYISAGQKQGMIIDGQQKIDEQGKIVAGGKFTVTSASGGTAWLLKGKYDTLWTDTSLANYTFQNITLTGEKPNGSGVIRLNERATLDLINFKADSITKTDGSAQVWGGVIELANNGRVRISGSYFSGVNTQSKGEGGLDSVTGGVIYVQGNEETQGVGQSVISYIKDSNFEGNTLTSLEGILQKDNKDTPDVDETIIGYRNAYGGAIYVEGKIEKISNSKFIGNSVQTEGKGVTVYGGAIAAGGIPNKTYTDRGIPTIGEIGDLTQFLNNYAKNLNGNGAGGAIYSSGGITKFIGTQFEENYVDAINAYGGAIASVRLDVADAKIAPAKIERIQRANFKNNYVSASNTAKGGAIYTGGYSEIITGYYDNNHANGASVASGGALYNAKGKMEDPAHKDQYIDKVAQNISGWFNGNYVQGREASGGALYNEGIIKRLAKLQEAGDDNLLNAEFIGNYAAATTVDKDGKEAEIENGQAVGGGVYNNGTIESLTATFQNNYVKGAYAHGGGLANTTILDADGNVVQRGIIENIEPILNDQETGKTISVQFTNNYAFSQAEGGEAKGGAIYNEGKIGDIQKENNSENMMTFNGNYVETTGNNGSSTGGAISNSQKGKLGNIIANFTYNVAKSVYNAFGGAIHNEGTTSDISSVFLGNSVSGTNAAYGGAVYNNGTLENIGYNSAINSSFSQNHAIATNEALGGAIYNNAKLGNIKADFSDNVADGDVAQGGAIYTTGTAGDGVISGTFKGNEAKGKNTALGGAVWAMSDSQDKPVVFVNSLFENNRAYLYDFSANATRATTQALGGAVYGNALKFVADGAGKNTSFQGNTAGDTKNAIYVAGSTGANVEFAALNGGKVSVYDDVDGENYDMLISGDSGNNYLNAESSQVAFYGTVDNVNNLTLGENSLTRLAGTIKAKNYQASAGSLMHIGRTAEITVANDFTGGGTLMFDLSIDAAKGKVKNGLITVEGQVLGTTDVIVNALNDAKFDGMLAKFVEAPKDTSGTQDSFNVARVLGSSYKWESRMKAQDGEDGHVWYLAIKEQEPPVQPTEPIAPINPINPPVDPDNPPVDPDNPPVDPDNPPVNPDNPDDDPSKPNENKPNQDKPTAPSNPIYEAEVAAYTGLQTIAVEQNRSIANSVAKGIAAKKSTLCYQETCGIAELMPKKEAWIDMTYENAKIDTPAEVDAKISGTTLGIDFYRLGNERAGLFGAYRHGKYDLSGKGRYYSETGSDVTNKSWLGGAYYQYDDENWKVLGTVFAGKQKMDIKTDDHLAFADTDAKQYGASAEVSKHFELTDEISLSPSLGLYYTTLDIDTIHDNLRKQAKFGTLHYLEAEAGVAVEYVSCYDGNTRRVYVKPSIIKTFADGGKTRMGDIDKPLDTFEERTLGRLELGGNFDVNDKWNGYAETGYTFGDDYRAYDFTIGVGYRF